MKIWFDKITKKDGKLLKSWWNANTQDYFFLKKRDKDKFYQLIKQ